MSEDQNTNNDQKKGVTDDDLNNAWMDAQGDDSGVGDSSDQNAQGAQDDSNPDTNTSDSGKPEKQGSEFDTDVWETRLRKNEGHIGTLISQQTQLNQQLRDLTNTLQKVNTTPEDPYAGFEGVPTTKEEITQLVNVAIKQNQLEMTNAQKVYETDFVNTVANLSAEEDDPIAKQGIEDELFKNFNERRSNNGATDAATNYAKASRAYYKKLAAGTKKENPLKGQKPTAPLGGVTNQKSSSRPGAPVKLDEHAQSLVDYINRTAKDDKHKYTDEKVGKILNSDMPAYMGGR